MPRGIYEAQAVLRMTRRDFPRVDDATVWLEHVGAVVARVAALTAPTHVMTAAFRASLDDVAARDPYAVLVVIADAEERFRDSSSWELSAREEHVGAPPPVDLLRGRLRGPDDLAAAIEGTDLRWRLDVIMVLDLYLA